MGGETDLFPTFYQIEELRARPEGPSSRPWKTLRSHAETELLRNKDLFDKLYYAALTIDGAGLSSYGNCTITLKERMIAHRTSCFEGNSALLFDLHHNFNAQLRSNWSDRGRLCAAKLGPSIGKLSDEELARLLLRIGPTPEEDEFVEAHIFGELTLKAFEHILIDVSKCDDLDRLLARALSEKLKRNGVPVDVILS
jgi:hypothetical protein